ncbi:hypothetical protein ABFX02_02G049900 [Erythranthe guttata]
MTHLTPILLLHFLLVPYSSDFSIFIDFSRYIIPCSGAASEGRSEIVSFSLCSNIEDLFDTHFANDDVAMKTCVDFDGSFVVVVWWCPNMSMAAVGAIFLFLPVCEIPIKLCVF